MAGQASITQNYLEYMLVDETVEPTALPLSLLSEITDGFSDKLEIGRGGFSTVYKATLKHGAVAVKKLSQAYLYEQVFQREVECLMKAKHKNIVRFLGYCADTQGNMENDNGKLVLADVQQRLLCFEYLPKGSLGAYIKDSSGELEWRKCYQVIKGICEGLNYLHQKNIWHLDLKPGNILLDEDMMPKIIDFGVSRCFEEHQTRVITKNVIGTMGYVAPEAYSSSEITITHKFDLYSLGVIIIETLTGKKGYQITIENVLEVWSNKTSDALQWEQIQVCAKIGIECKEHDPARRPASMNNIIDRLAKTESSTHVIPAGGTSELLLLHHQLALRFPFEPSKVITCPLQLTNNTDKHVIFRLMDKSMESSFLRLPLCGLVPPNSPYTLIVSTQEKEELPLILRVDVILQSATLILEDYVNIPNFQILPFEFFQDLANAVQEVKLTALYTLPRHITTSSSMQPISPTIKIVLSMEIKISKYHGGYSLDTNQAKQWIMIGENNGHVGFWDSLTQRKVDSLKISATDAIMCVKFIARKQWIVAGTDGGNVHVYDYEKRRNITSFTAGPFERLSSLAVHPTKPYLLSAGTYMKLWDWDKGWECVQTFEYEHFNTIVAFNPNDTFASASTLFAKDYNCPYGTSYSSTCLGDYSVKVWSLDSPRYNYALDGHSSRVLCLDFFTCHDQEFLVTGSDDKTAKIWYLQKKICAYTLEAFLSPVTSVLYQPNLQTLITGSEDGAIYLWSTTNCRIYSCPPTLTKIINIGCVGAVTAVYHLTRVMGRVVIGKQNTVAIMDIDNENCQEQTTDYTEQQLSADTRQHAGDTTSKEIAGSVSKLLYIHPLKLCFPYHPNEPISCSLHLTNKTDENVAFRLFDKSGKSPWCLTKLPLYGIVPHRSAYTLIVTMKEEMKLKKETELDIVIQSSLLGDKYMVVFKDQSECDKYFEEAKEFGNMVHEVTLEAYYVWPRDSIYEDQNISVKYNPDDLWSLDAHPTEPWILTGHKSEYARVWNPEMKYPINSFKVPDGGAVRSIKFIARKDCIVAVTARRDGFHVFDCACITEIKRIRSVLFSIYDMLDPILAVHPILPSVLSPASSGIMLSNWDPEWKHTQIFPRVSVSTAAFIPGDDNSFVHGSKDGKVEVWRPDSEDPEYFLPGHFDKVNCLDFITRGDQQCLISGSNDSTAKIWDLQKRECIYTLQAMSPVLCVLAHPNLSVLITGTKHGIIQIWSSTNFRLKRTINLGGGGPVVGLACLTGSRRIVIGQENAISTMEIHADGTLPPKSATEAERSQAKAKHGETMEWAETQEQQALPPKSATEAERSQNEAEHSETEEPAATQEQQALPPKSATEAERSQDEAEHGETEEPAATQEQQALPPKSRTQRRRENRRTRALAKQAEAERSPEQDVGTHKSACSRVPSRK